MLFFVMFGLGKDCCVLLTGEDSSNKKGTNTGCIYNTRRTIMMAPPSHTHYTHHNQQVTVIVRAELTRGLLGVMLSIGKNLSFLEF